MPGDYWFVFTGDCIGVAFKMRVSFILKLVLWNIMKNEFHQQCFLGLNNPENNF